ncbi:hypothetical protein LUZ60_009454 [Juncus effusus]|nr:hypothetical protein LUZ60_009454 [Juncus effusus]
MEAYKYFVRTNREFVQNLESLANAITWLLPERFSNSEIGPEAVYAILGTVSAVNQHIVDTSPPKPGVRQAGPKYATSAFPWSLLVSILKDGEAVVEVASQHFFGQDGKWSFLAAMEGVKALVRLAAFRESGYKMLLQGGEAVNEGKGLDKTFPKNEGPSHNFPDNLPKNLEGRALAALNKFGESSIKRSAPSTPASKLTLSTIWHERGASGQLFLIGEVIHVLRPFLYVLFIRKYGIKSWAPWLVSLSVDLIGMSIISNATGTGNGSRYQLSETEKEELRRRKNILALYIIRDPFFTKYTRNRLEKVDKLLSPVPLVSFFTSKFIELLIGIQTRYTYTSGS